MPLETSLSAHTILQVLKLGASRKSKLLLAVSGGIDSMTLLHILAKEKDRYGALAVAHVNHQLRGDDSHRDEAFVRETCEKLGVACYTKQVQTAASAAETKRGIEETARDERYTFFEEIASEHGFDLIITAHTKN